jgi:hypothetical protein
MLRARTCIMSVFFLPSLQISIARMLAAHIDASSACSKLVQSHGRKLRGMYKDMEG